MKKIAFALALMSSAAWAGQQIDLQAPDGGRHAMPGDEMGLYVGRGPNGSNYSPDLGADYVNTRGECRVFTADGAIANNPGQLISIYAVGLTANDGFLIYDNPSAASGTVIANFTGLPAGYTPIANLPDTFTTGAYIDVTLTTGRLNICWNE